MKMAMTILLVMLIGCSPTPTEHVVNIPPPPTTTTMQPGPPNSSDPTPTLIAFSLSYRNNLILPQITSLGERIASTHWELFDFRNERREEQAGLNLEPVFSIESYPKEVKCEVWIVKLNVTLKEGYILSRPPSSDDVNVFEEEPICYILPPVAEFEYVVNNCDVGFIDKSDGEVNRWSWLFGDSNKVDTSQNPNHTYSAVGTYDVSLIVTDVFDRANEAQQQVEIVVCP